MRNLLCAFVPTRYLPKLTVTNPAVLCSAVAGLVVAATLLGGFCVGGATAPPLMMPSRQLG